MTTILVVDDSEADQYLCALAIEEHDPSIRLVAAYDGDEALEMLDAAERLPDLILLDINMPRMDGFEFLDHYSSEYPAAVVVMLTSSDQEKDRERALAYEVVRSYVVKPLDEASVSQLLLQLDHPGPQQR